LVTLRGFVTRGSESFDEIFSGAEGTMRVPLGPPTALSRNGEIWRDCENNATGYGERGKRETPGGGPLGVFCQLDGPGDSNRDESAHLDEAIKTIDEKRHDLKLKRTALKEEKAGLKAKRKALRQKLKNPDLAIDDKQ
jgi:hypothetical protein